MAARKTTKRKKATPRTTRARRARPKPKRGEADRGGRPSIQWTEENARDVHRLSRAGNTVGDIAAILGVSKRSLESAVADETGPVRESYRLGVSERRDALRTAQLRIALAGNPTMLIWLGKQELGQRDTKAIELSGGDEPVKVEGDLGPLVQRKIEEFLRSRGK